MSVLRLADTIRTGRPGLGGAWRRPYWDMPIDRGLIFTSLVAADKPLLDKLRHENIPVVQRYRQIEDEPSDWVGIDDYSAAFEMASHLIATGRRKFAVLGGPDTSCGGSDLREATEIVKSASISSRGNLTLRHR